MTPWILAVLALWLGQVFFAGAFQTVLSDDPQAATADHMRGKDNPPERSRMGARALRAQRNMSESLPVFLALALLLEMKGAPGWAIPGAITFLAGRTLYVPAYLAGIYGVRSLMWTVGLIGLGMMAAAAAGAMG